MKLRLYHYWRSSSSWRVRWAFALKNIPCEFEAIDLLKEEAETEPHRNRNPMGYVPVLEFLDGKPPYRFLAESMAIIEWADETYPEPSLLPGDALQRARIRQLAEIINAGTQPIQNPSVAQLYSSDPVEQKKWNQKWIRNGLSAYERLVKETAGKFSMGDQITLADLFLIPQVYNANRFEVAASEFPTLERIYRAASQTEEFKASEPEKFKPKS